MKPTFTWYRSMAGSSLPLCGEGGNYQVQVQDSLNSSFELLAETPADEPGHDKRLSLIVRKVNADFNALAKAALLDRRRQMRKEGLAAEAERLEVTILITDRGLQLAFVHALESKLVAATPAKGLARRLFGWAMKKRRWTMPLGEAAADDMEKPEPGKAKLPARKPAAKKAKK